VVWGPRSPRCQDNAPFVFAQDELNLAQQGKAYLQLQNGRAGERAERSFALLRMTALRKMSTWFLDAFRSISASFVGAAVLTEGPVAGKRAFFELTGNFKSVGHICFL
jgi:hypothetical protein